MKKHEVRNGQSLADIAIERYGTIDALPWLIEDNPQLNRSISGLPLPGTVLEIRDDSTEQGEAVLQLWNRDGFRMASAPTEQTVQSSYMEPDYTNNGYVE